MAGSFGSQDEKPNKIKAKGRKKSIFLAIKLVFDL
jgi:hypothetical protein